MRIRIKFAKTEAMRYTSHLDLHRTWERTLRRAGIPLAYSQGYNPRPKMNLASALPLGFTSQCEIIDVWLETRLPIAQIKTLIQDAAPPGVEPKSIREIANREPKLPTLLEYAEYLVTLLDKVDDLNDRIERVKAFQHLKLVRRGKLYDLRPLIEDLEVLPNNDQDQQRIYMRLAAHQSATGRPDEVVKALGLLPHTTRIERISLIFQMANN
jgi:radical SAM-linked protein